MSVLEDVIASLPEGARIKDVALRRNVSRQTVHEWLAAAPQELATRYARAQEMAAEYWADRHVEVIDGLMSGAIAADVGRVLANEIKWQAQIHDRKRYGDKVEVTHAHTISISRAIQDGMARAQTVIDGQITELCQVEAHSLKVLTPQDGEDNQS